MKNTKLRTVSIAILSVGLFFAGNSCSTTETPRIGNGGDADSDSDSDSDMDGGGTSDGDSDADSDTDTDTDSGSDVDTDSDSDTDTDTDSNTDTECEDKDEDGWCESFDCDDDNDKVHPDQEDILDNGIDDDCDGATDELSDHPCDQAIAKKSNIGCEYWAADLDNAENVVDNAAGGQFAVAIANIGSNGTAHVQVHINNADQGLPLDLELVEETDITEKDLYIFRLPRRDVDGENIKKNVDNGPQTWLSSRAFRITSSVPVVAYQFNTLNQVFSNDASLLLPTSGLGKDHLVVGYPPSGPIGQIGPLPGPKNRAYITILGSEEETKVDVVPTYGIVAGEGVNAIPAGQQATFTIGPFDVINLETKFMSLLGKAPDLTGSIVHSDKPVAVFFGVDLAMVSSIPDAEESCCAEHIEQQVLPSEAMGKKFVVSHSAKRSSGSPEPDMYRIIAYGPNTQVDTSLPAPNNSFTLGAGEYKELFTTTGFVVDSTGPLHVAQFLVIQSDCEPYSGDSALLYVPAVDQRRGLYVFTTGKGFSSNWAVISMPHGAEVKIDNQAITATPDCNGPRIDGDLNGVTFEEWTCKIKDGVHLIHTGPTPEETNDVIGVYVYGYYSAGSYAYPAGSDLREINDIIVK
jgi:IgGFc binding protein